MKLSGRTILITSGSSGIGLELATQLLAMGDSVIVTGRNQDALDKAKAHLPNSKRCGAMWKTSPPYVIFESTFSPAFPNSTP